MQNIISRLKACTTRSFFIAFLCTSFVNTSHAITAEEASQQVKSLPCKDQMNTDQTLDRSIRNHAQSDIGWRIFQEDGYFDVERAVLMNKGMELHYRWRVQLDGNIAAENDRTSQLCNAS